MSLFQAFVPSLTRTPTSSTPGSSVASAPTVKPAYEIKETTEAFGLTVYVPGVAKDGLELTTEDGQVRITGRRAWQQPAGWTTLSRESGETAYELVLTHDNAIDAGKISAELRDGVLRASLPKHEALKPRKIDVS